MKAYIQARGDMGYADGNWAIGITNIATRQTTVPPLAFKTRGAAQDVVDAIVEAAPLAYTTDYPWRDED